MLPSLPPNMTTDRWMDINSIAIDRLIKNQMPKSEFRSGALPREQARRLTLLSNCASSVHPCWDDLYRGRLSAACRFEWGRLQLFIVAEVLPALASTEVEFFLVTVADKRWRVAPEVATADAFEPPRRKVRAAMQSLRSEGFTPVFVAGYEMSGDRSLDDEYTFEPHAHILVGGVPKHALKTAFRVRLPRSARGRDKPVKVKHVATEEVGNILGYLTKMKAQDRVQYPLSDGRRSRNPNRMPADEEAHWLRCMASVPITHLIQFGGFAEPITSRFMRLEMATMIGALA